jgi:hypothetical protein
MANKENNLDRYFREKLGQYEEKPAALAWEKLEQELGKKKSANILFLRLAASLLLVLGLAFVFWQFINPIEQTESQLAEVEEVLEGNEASKIQETFALEEEKNEGQYSEKRAETSQKLPMNENQDSKKAEKEHTKGALLAQNDAVASPQRMKETIIELPEIPILELPTHEAIASSQKLSFEPEEEVSYKVIIKSSGIKDEPKKPNLIEGLENNVNKIGTFLSKVEQGFADLQDAKNNLFASNSPIKETNE